VSIAACLLLYSLVVLLLGPPLLRWLTDSGHAPHLGVAAWLTAIVSVLLSWVAALGFAVVEVVRRWDHPGPLIASCLAWLRGVVSGEAGIVPQIVVVGSAIAVGVAAAVATVRLMHAWRAMRCRAHQHAHDVRLVGHRTDDSDVVVIDAPRPAAYCVSGRPPAIVVTTAALSALDEPQLAAVLAHERAHLAGHHPTVMTCLRGLATVFPRVTLMAEGAHHVSRLLEMCADDAAARRHGSRALLSGLIALCSCGPAEALGAADVAVLARANRLAAAPAQLVRTRTQAALISAVAILGSGPVIIAALAASGALLCGA
jgi:Zn-dependent protease with chaperone function